MHLRLPMWSAISKTRSSTINKKEVQILLKIVLVIQLHTYTLVTKNCRRNLVTNSDTKDLLHYIAAEEKKKFRYENAEVQLVQLPL